MNAALAQQAHDAAIVREREAQAARRDGKSAAEKEIAIAGQAVRAQSIDRYALDALLSTERQALTKVEALSAAVQEAAAEVAASRTRLDAANADLFAERRMTRKKERIADSATKAWHRALDASQEMERQDQFADTWRAK